jgi:hypothetical protein
MNMYLEKQKGSFINGIGSMKEEKYYIGYSIGCKEYKNNILLMGNFAPRFRQNRAKSKR